VNPEDRELRLLLGGAHTVAVVGLSSKPNRPSHDIAAYLQRHGYRIVPVNPNEREVLGEAAYASLLDIPIGAKVLWLQEGIVNDEAYRIASDGGLDVIMGVCIRHTRDRLMRGEAT
jgi:predicted CoA-binding protein